ncbi:MAG: ATP-binding protein, partial [Verrucomicrobiales bacterium]
SGAIYKYVSKPWDVPQLDHTLKRALEFFLVQRERDQLLKEKLSVLHNIMITDRVVSLGVLAAGLGHHIRNSLVAVRTFLDLAPEKLKDEIVDLEEMRNPTFWQDFYGHVQGQVKRITELLGDLGFASQEMEADFNDDVRVQDLLAEVVAGFSREAAEKQVQITSSIPVDLPLLKADKPKLRRLFQLLVQDELLNLQNGGSVQISAKLGEGADSRQQIELSIADDGPGLAKESLRSIFDPFFLRSNKPGEFGLNLMACFFLVYHHGGKIEVQSEPGKGTNFNIALPLNPGAKTSTMKEEDFLAQVLSNEVLWEKLLAGTM